MHMTVPGVNHLQHKADKQLPPQAVHEQQAPLCAAKQQAGGSISPKRRAREVTLAWAKRGLLPLKVRSECFPQGAAFAVSPELDSQLPVKKRPVYGDIAGPEAAASLKHLAPNAPVKIAVPTFLLEEPARVFTVPPGL
jgi:hypothetical protein